ncbi:MAG: GDSL-type esterase/lipase family protein [Clostridium sp.]|nr:GDSL-type esterase/lipase family protein [Clostridium sp.]
MKRTLMILATAVLALSGARAQTANQAGAKPEKYEYGVFYYQRASLFDTLPVDSGDIIMLGNSLTNGCEWHELLGMPNVKNRGISSDVIQGVDDRLGSIINGKPAKIFLMIGVNDISHDLGADSISTAYLKLIDHIRAELPETKLYVQSCLPINISFGMYKGMTGRDQEIRDVNEKVKAKAEEKGFAWIDLYSSFIDEEGHMKREYTNDGLHLLAPGYLQWRECIMPYVLEQ